MVEDRELGGVGTKVVFENDQVRVWVLQLAPGERSAVHQHDLDHLLIQIRGDRIAVEPEPDARGPAPRLHGSRRDPGHGRARSEGRDRDRGERRRRAVLRDHRGAEGDVAGTLARRAAGCGRTTRRGGDLDTGVSVPAQRRSGDRCVPHRAARAASGRGAHGRRAGARAAVRVRPRHRRSRVGDGRRRLGRCDRARGLGAGAAAHASARPAVRVGAREARRRRHAVAARARLRIGRSRAARDARAHPLGAPRRPATCPTSSASSWRADAHDRRSGAVHVASHRGGVQDPGAVVVEHPLR